jgi:hypothetical protein
MANEIRRSGHNKNPPVDHANLKAFFDGVYQLAAKYKMKAYMVQAIHVRGDGGECGHSDGIFPKGESGEWLLDSLDTMSGCFDNAANDLLEQAGVEIPHEPGCPMADDADDDDSEGGTVH